MSTKGNALKASARPARKPRRKWLHRLKITALVLFIFASVGVLAGSYVWGMKLKEAEPLAVTLSSVKDKIDIAPTEILSRDGKVLFSMVGENREWVALKDVPKIVQDATLAAEDKRFYSHSGIDPWSLVRQAVTNARERSIEGGASTLTMQVAKRVYTSPKQTIERKLQDMALAVEIEKHHTKEFILEFYLNQVYYGSWSYGIKKAAETYFDKDLDELTIAEAATLARCVRRPSFENPIANPKVALHNRDAVLVIMRDEKMITEAQYQAAKNEQLVLNKRKPSPGLRTKKVAPYFVDYVLKTIERSYPDLHIDQGGYKIQTTLDASLQDAAEDRVKTIVDRYRRSRVTTGSFLLLNRDGEILAMVGGYDYNRNQFNVCSQGKRQPGSSFKPFVYALALEQRILSPNSALTNAQQVFRLSGQPPYSPRNSTGRYGGSVDLRTAISFSINVPAVDALYRYGRSRGLADFSSRCRRTFGFEHEIYPYLSSALGASEVSPIEMARGYSTFMLSGGQFEPFGISQITGPDGDILVSNRGRITRGKLKADVADLLDSYMRSVVTSGTAKAASGITNARGKTGTTSDNRDAWFVGYTDKFLGVGWIANEILEKRPGGIIVPKYEEMSSNVFGGTHTVQMWTDIVARAQRKYGERGTSHNAPAIDGWKAETPNTRDENPPVNTEPNPDENRNGDPAGSPEQAPPIQPADTPPGERTTPNDDGSQGGMEPPATKPEPGPKTTPRQTPPAAKPPEEERGTITVMVCADTGQLASAACPEKTPRTYRRGREPKSTCRKHGG